MINENTNVIRCSSEKKQQSSIEHLSKQFITDDLKEKTKQNKGEKFYQIEQNLHAIALHNNQASGRNTIATQPSKRLLQIKTNKLETHHWPHHHIHLYNTHKPKLNLLEVEQ